MATTTATTATTAALPRYKGAELGRSTVQASRSAFAGLLLRDLTVLKKNLKEFLPRTILQPFLLVFVFLYVFPTIGQGIGSGRGAAGESASGEQLRGGEPMPARHPAHRPPGRVALSGDGRLLVSRPIAPPTRLRANTPRRSSAAAVSRTRMAVPPTGSCAVR